MFVVAFARNESRVGCCERRALRFMLFTKRCGGRAGQSVARKHGRGPCWTRRGSEVRGPYPGGSIGKAPASREEGRAGRRERVACYPPAVLSARKGVEDGGSERRGGRRRRGRRGRHGHFDEMFDRRESGGSPRAAMAAEGKTRDAGTAERDAARVDAFVGPTASVDQPRPAPGFGKPPARRWRKPSDPQSQPRIKTTTGFDSPAERGTRGRMGLDDAETPKTRPPMDRAWSAISAGVSGLDFGGAGSRSASPGAASAPSAHAEPEIRAHQVPAGGRRPAAHRRRFAAQRRARGGRERGDAEETDPRRLPRCCAWWARARSGRCSRCARKIAARCTR